MDALFTVQCPSCGEIYVSTVVTILGFIKRRTYLIWGAVLVLAVAGVVAWVE